MAKKVEIEIDINDKAVEGSIAQLKELKKELKNTAAGSDEFKKIYNQIDDLEDKLKSAKNTSSDWVDSLESAGGPLGMVGTALNKAKVATQSFGAALKATGIGLVVAAIGMLVAAFSQTEGSMKKLEPLMIMLEKLFAGLVEAFQPLLEAFVEIAMKVLPVFISGIKNFYGGLMALFTLVKEAGTGVGKILKGIFTLDTKALEEGYNQLKGSWDKTKESFNQFTNNFEKGYAKQTATQKKNAADAKEAADKALAERLKNMEANDKLSEAELQKMREQELALATSEQQKLDIEKSFAKKSFDMRLQDINDKMALYKKDSIEYKNLLTDRTKLEAERIKEETGFKTQQVELTKKTNKELLDEEIQALNLKKAEGTIKEDEYQKAIFDIKVKYLKDKKDLIDAEIAYDTYLTEQKKKRVQEERDIALSKLQNDINDLDAKNKLADLDFEEDLKRLEEKRIKIDESEKLELAAAEGNEVEKNKVRQKYADLRKGITLEEIATEKASAQAKADIQLAYIGLISQFGTLLQQIAGKNKALAIAGLIIEKAAAIGQIWASNAIANAKAVAASPLTFGQPWVTINTVSAILSTAATVAASVKAINEINSANSSAGGNSGNSTSAQSAPRPQGYAQGGLIGGVRHSQGGTMIEAEQGEAIMTRGAVTMFGPLLSQLNQMGGGTPFGSTMVRANDNPKSGFPSDYTQQPVQIVKTYVVEGELTSQQQKQARLKDLSTI